MSGEQTIQVRGRVLYLTADPELLRRQLEGESLRWDPSMELLDNISTDEITPGWVCYHHDETLGRYALVGLRGGLVGPDAIARGGFEVVVSGQSKGCGSSREAAPFAERCAGIRIVIARSIEKIYAQNAQNIGLLLSTDFELLRRIEAGEPIPLDAFTRGLDPISAEIVRSGGLFAYNRRRLSGALRPPQIRTAPRPMTLAEKILAAHAVRDAASDAIGVAAVAPGDAFFARADIRFSHEYVTPMADALMRRALGEQARIADPGSVYLFRDHLTFLGQVMPEERRRMGLLELADGLARTQEAFSRRHGLRLYGESPLGGSEAICHNAVVEDLALPGMLVIGTDSHTCMAGVLGCLAFGVGSTDMANAWFTRDVRVRVPETVRFVLRGRLRAGVTAKDLILHLLAQPFFRISRGIGKVVEFAGEGLRAMPLDERATLTNMAVEAGGFTGICEADEVVVDYLVRMRGLSREAIEARIVRGDPDASYLETFEVDLGVVRPMVATPGDPRNGVPLDELAGPVRIDIAYGGSCTGGKKADMDMYAAVLRAALARGMRVAPGVRCFIQYGSQHIRRYAEERGYDRIFAEAGAEVIPPSCGACIAAGPGISRSPDEVTVSAQNRNFPGRSGPGKVYLASPLVVAASAVAGFIASPEQVVGPIEWPA
ncbi:MAG: aconitase family protein [Myxococcota bacterium]|nr:aconitase family protein [Myxococcota bacterium]MDW8361945.1 aconitase family protein [Myxococcales bacterium]